MELLLEGFFFCTNHFLLKPFYRFINIIFAKIKNKVYFLLLERFIHHPRWMPSGYWQNLSCVMHLNGLLTCVFIGDFHEEEVWPDEKSLRAERSVRL